MSELFEAYIVNVNDTSFNEDAVPMTVNSQTEHIAGAFRNNVSILILFLRLGCTSFGGPIAHLGYYREEFVKRRGWLTDATFAELVALAQFLPGPASTQISFTVGLMRGGWLGGIMAWIGFTLPSALLMVIAAYGLASAKGPAAHGLIEGLKLIAVAVVAQAVLGMWRTLCPDHQRGSIAILALAIMAAFPTLIAQLGVILAGAFAGLFLCGGHEGEKSISRLTAISTRAGIIALVLFFGLLMLLPLMASLFNVHALNMAEAFYRAGALVFGGGHVVLPLLQEATVTPGWISNDQFLAGYGLAQALPGPLFAISAFLGTSFTSEPNGIEGATLCLVAIFLPGLLVMVGALPFWDKLRTQPKAKAMMAGANAAVVGLLAAALYNPIWLSTVTDGVSFAIAALAFGALALWRAPVLVVVVVTAGIGLLRGMLLIGI